MPSTLALAGIGLFIVAVLLANLPFLVERYFGVKRPASGQTKSLGFRFFELLVCYGLTLGVGWLIEGRLGQVHQQGWQFYAITLCLFLVLAFPGFVYRYLRK